MISSAKNYTKKKPHKTDRQDPRTNGALTLFGKW